MRTRLKLMRAQRAAGFTLIEVIVAMAIFTVLISVSFVAVTQLTRATTSAQARAQSSSAVLVVFQTIDRQVRYASAINYPGVGSTAGVSYIEFFTAAASTNVGYDVCTQWRYDQTSGVLQMRQWKNGSSPSTFVAKASEIKGSASASYPFTLLPAVAGGALYQRLQLALQAGGARTADRTSITTTYVARNSSIQSVSNADSNGDAVSDNPVCLPVGARP
ncbi:hypothetical protein BH11ACT3_BH11ACT3_12640 [soil metagenome]